ncbi:ribosomal-processing cysteine protease Prp [Enterococcus pallens]|uniref:Ribosomal processing cysteine protease Prp n=1 Tax=Enterococcus pallens ATCC BAA-351 TaxID=1158607 RepID=R2QI13_9ENTE|nr:ribosomal-processing cysteine protease Prp [Enterococcus pallens]EOH94828.1 hypothetical protein UAU_01750 [Enterococcus pallens ATCC BAA-351]EOU14853.1 hypothetical protein I588_04503 [Enterococcus pallens ATCC BAA-351]
MIQATFNKENGRFVDYEITGHAYFADLGNDIVCAATSSLFVTITNQLLLKADVNVEAEKAYKVVLNSQGIIEDILVNTLLTGLRDIESAHPENIKVKVIG